MSKQVHYHQLNREPIVLHVVAEHKDGTVSLAREVDGLPVIEGIALSVEGGDGNGRAVIITDAPKAKSPKAKASKPKESSESQESVTSTESEEFTPAGDDGTSSAPPDE